MLEETFRCTKCEKFKTDSEFSHGNGVRHWWCKQCRSEEANNTRRLKGIKEKSFSVIINNEKLCMNCNNMLSLDNFSPTIRGLGNVSCYCKTCANILYPGDKEKQRLATQKYRERYREKNLANHRLTQFKRRHNQKVLSDGTITNEYLIFIYSLEYCFYCISYTEKHNRTLDHIVPLIKGGEHSEDNTVMACKSCNSSKRDIGVEEFFHKLAKQGEVFNVC